MNQIDFRVPSYPRTHTLEERDVSKACLDKILNASRSINEEASISRIRFVGAMRVLPLVSLVTAWLSLIVFWMHLMHLVSSISTDKFETSSKESRVNLHLNVMFKVFDISFLLLPRSA